MLRVDVSAFGGFPVLLDPSPDIGFTIGFAAHPATPAAASASSSVWVEATSEIDPVGGAASTSPSLAHRAAAV
ncbi:hypothetical protein DSM104299_00491 [Baekduia alba]|nr:hypothetical protein DSM104299_00491 [Baekduia alba]